MKYHYILKRTDQLTGPQKRTVIDILAANSISCQTQVEFDRKYSETPLGYSYHGLMMADDSIIGIYSTIPYAYRYFERSVIFCQLADVVVSDKHRANPFHVYKTANTVNDAMKQDGVSFCFGRPNENLYNYLKKMLSFRLVGELDVHVLLLNIGQISGRLRFANVFSRICAKLLVHLPAIPFCGQHSMPIAKVCDDVFLRQRYNHRHQVCNLPQGGKGVYCVVENENTGKTLLIVDISPLTAANLTETMRKLYAVGIAECADLIMYVGQIPFPKLCLARIPHFVKRFNNRLVGKIINPELVDDRVYDLKNWSVNTSNMDVP